MRDEGMLGGVGQGWGSVRWESNRQQGGEVGEKGMERNVAFDCYSDSTALTHQGLLCTGPISILVV